MNDEALNIYLAPFLLQVLTKIIIPIILNPDTEKAAHCAALKSVIPVLGICSSLLSLTVLFL
jgi:hypothetical protein